jgi:3-oxoacyl-(acyl-carrier-protein) synthase
MSKLKISGLAAATANGLTKESVFESVLKGASSVDAKGLCSIAESDWEMLQAKTPGLLKSSRCTQLAYHTLTQAIQDAGWTPEQVSESGFLFATTTSQIDVWEKCLPQTPGSLVSPQNIELGVQNQSLGLPLVNLCKEFSIHGPQGLIASSCSASLQALAIALLWIRAKKVRRCIVGATEINSRLTSRGFGSLRLLSTSPCRPFDSARKGINLGEASAFILLEEEDLEPSRWGYLLGAGLSSDAFHSTSPETHGAGSQRSMQQALDSAGVQASQVDWIYAHGTGSPANDFAEAHAIHTVFPGQPWVSSTKSIHGHTLAASGVVESVLGLMAMKTNQVLGTASCSNPDSNLPVRTTENSVNQPISFFLKNSLGFGGINASVVFSSSRVVR